MTKPDIPRLTAIAAGQTKHKPREEALKKIKAATTAQLESEIAERRAGRRAA